MPSPARQSIQKLLPEPTVQEQVKAGELIIEYFEPPPDIAEKVV